jgi:hypothetical protein
MLRVVSRIEFFAAPLMALLMSSCGGLPEVESTKAGLSATYVSGHLGTTSECPAAQNTAKLPAGGAGSAVCLRASIAPGSDAIICGRCNNGAVLLEVKSIAIGHDVPVNVTKVELVQDNGQADNLDLVEALSTDGKLVSSLSPGASVTLRILFPAQSRFAETTNTGRIRITIAGDNADTLEIETPALRFVPAVAT